MNTYEAFDYINDVNAGFYGPEVKAAWEKREMDRIAENKP